MSTPEIERRRRPEAAPRDDREPEAVRAPDLRALAAAAQAQIGNRAAARFLSRDGPVDAGVPIAGVSAAPTDFAAAEAFKAGAAFGPKDVVPATSGRGGFEGTYDPKTEQFLVKMRCGVAFKDALVGSGDSVTVDPSVPKLINKLPRPGPRRTKFILAHQWKADDKTEFLAGVKSAVEGTWSNQYEFHINKPDWTWIGATVNVDIEVHEQTGAKAAGDHLLINSVKVPSGEDINDFGAETATDRGSDTDPHDQSMLVGSTDIKPREDNLLRKSVFFANNSADLTSGAKSKIKDFATTFNGAAAGTPGSRPADVTLEAHTSTPGTDEYNMRLAQRRADAVRTELTSQGFRNITTRVKDDIEGEAGATGDAAHDRRVDLIADGGVAQVVVAHEFGHAFGLADEYTTKPSQLGTPAGHDDDVKAMQKASGLPETGAIREDNGNIMSDGTFVLPQHYATFHHALVTITSVPEWALGPKTAKPGATGGAAAPATPAPVPVP